MQRPVSPGQSQQIGQSRSAPAAPGVRARRRQQTEQRILGAARKLFAEAGYERTTIRAVAAAARADPGLVMRYYGSKQQLFDKVAAMPADDLGPGDPDEVAGRILASLSEKLSTEPVSTLAMLRSITHPDAAARVRASANRQGAELAAAIPADDAEVRAGLIGAITLGTVIARHLLQLDGLRAATPDQITDLLSPYIHSLMKSGAVPTD
ncbi:MAG TPA: TetR family transcriptional regulator [Actinocrinis sp.]